MGAARSRILTTVPPDFRALDPIDWSGMAIDVLDRRKFSPAGLLRRVLRGGNAYGAVLLNGSARIDQLAAALLVRGRFGANVVIEEATWRRGTTSLDRLISRLGVTAIESPRTTYCVLSSDELMLFPRTWGVDASRVVFTPYCYTLTGEELEAPSQEADGIFAGGDSLRDYGPLLAAARRIPAQVTLAVARRQAAWGDLAPNVRLAHLSHAAFVESMRQARVVVVPIQAGAERSAGQQTYLNAMALGKLVVATDSPGVRDCIDHGTTGLIVPAGDADALARALEWALDSSREREIAQITARAQAVVRQRFRPIDHLRSLVGVAEQVISAENTRTELTCDPLGQR